MFNSPQVTQLMDRYRSTMPWLQRPSTPMGATPSWLGMSGMQWPLSGFGQLLGARPTPTYAMPQPMPNPAAAPATAAGTGSGQPPPMPAGWGGALLNMAGIDPQQLWANHWQGEQQAADAQRRAAQNDPTYVLPPFNAGSFGP